jgi:hypothetical protein
MTKREDFATGGPRRARRSYCKPCHSERTAEMRRRSPNKRCRTCNILAPRQAWPGVHCPKCRSLKAHQEKGKAWASDLTLEAQALLFPGRSWMRLAKEEKQRVFKLARVFCWAEDRPGFTGNGTRKQREAA